MYQAIIFDMDGVIINSKEHVEDFWEKKLHQYGIKIPEDEKEKRFHGRPARPTVNDLFAELPVNLREEIIEECAEYDASVEKYPMIPGVDMFISRCADKGIRIGLVTSALPGKVERMLAGLSITNPFEVMVTANQVKNGKPHSECYLLAAEKMNLDPQDIIVFEDSVSGVKSASGAGAAVVGINEGSVADILLDSGASAVQPDFKESVVVEGADWIQLFPQGKDGEIQFQVKTVI